LMINPFRTGDGSLLPADPREIGRKPVVVLLAPLFKWMVVAASTLDAQTEKQLRRVLDLSRLILHFPVPGGGRILAGLAGRGHDFPHEFIVRFVLVKTLADPIMKGKGGNAVLSLSSLISQDGIPFV